MLQPMMTYHVLRWKTVQPMKMKPLDKTRDSLQSQSTLALLTESPMTYRFSVSFLEQQSVEMAFLMTYQAAQTNHQKGSKLAAHEVTNPVESSEVSIHEFVFADIVDQTSRSHESSLWISRPYQCRSALMRTLQSTAGRSKRAKLDGRDGCGDGRSGQSI